MGIGETTASSGGWEARRIRQSPVAGGVRVAVKTVGVHEEGGVGAGGGGGDGLTGEQAACAQELTGLSETHLMETRFHQESELLFICF